MVASDEALVGASLAGDTSAFGVLIDRHVPRARALVRRVLPTDDAEDVVQEALLRAFLGLSSLRDPARFGAWLCGIALNLAKMRVRESRNELPLRVESGADGLVGSSAEDAAEALDAVRLVRQALDLLPEDQRQAVMLYYLKGLPTREIAAIVSASPGAVRVRLHRGRRSLREQLAPLRPSVRPARKGRPAMVEVSLHDVLVRSPKPPAGQEAPPLTAQRPRVVVLKESQGERVLPIWVGAGEGDALALHHGGELPLRPLTVDLMGRLLEASNSRVEKVVVSALRDQTFYATITVTTADESHEIDARPSDAFNLAVRVGAPIYVQDEVFNEASVDLSDEDTLGGVLNQHDLLAADENAEEMEWESLSADLVKSQMWQPPAK